MWFGWAHCLAHQVCLMFVQQFCYLLHQMCWKPGIVPDSTGSVRAAESLSIALWVCSGISYLGSCQVDAQLLWAGWGSVAFPTDSPTKREKEGVSWRSGDLISWIQSEAGLLRGISFNLDPLHLDNLQQKLFGGGKYLQRSGTTRFNAIYEVLKTSQLLY